MTSNSGALIVHTTPSGWSDYDGQPLMFAARKEWLIDICKCDATIEPHHSVRLIPDEVSAVTIIDMVKEFGLELKYCEDKSMLLDCAKIPKSMPQVQRIYKAFMISREHRFANVAILQHCLYKAGRSEILKDELPMAIVADWVSEELKRTSSAVPSATTTTTPPPTHKTKEAPIHSKRPSPISIDTAFPGFDATPTTAAAAAGRIRPK